VPASSSTTTSSLFSTTSLTLSSSSSQIFPSSSISTESAVSSSSTSSSSTSDTLTSTTSDISSTSSLVSSSTTSTAIASSSSPATPCSANPSYTSVGGGQACTYTPNAQFIEKETGPVANYTPAGCEELCNDLSNCESFSLELDFSTLRGTCIAWGSPFDPTSLDCNVSDVPITTTTDVYESSCYPYTPPGKRLKFKRTGQK
jgi:hypothetical protein